MSSSQAVQTTVAEAARLRRTSAASRFIWRAAPIAAAACAALAAGVRWAGWPPLLPLLAGTAALIAFGAYAYVASRHRDVSDLAAADIDRRAGLGGELRSASWFAARDSRDAWADFHVTRAAGRLAAVDWARLYPPMRAGREKALTAALAIAAIVLVLPAAGKSGILAVGAPGAAVRAKPAADVIGLPDDLRKQLEDLLKRAEDSALTANGGRPLTEAEVRDLLARLAQADLKNPKGIDKGGDPSGKQMEKAAADLKALADRAERASEMGSLSPEVRDALSEVAEKLSEKNDGQQAASPKDPSDAQGSSDAQKGEASQSKKGGNKEDASIQAVKDANAGGGIGVVMMSSDDPKAAQEAGLGLGGGSTERTNGGRMPDMAALRKETIEAYKDDTGDKTTQDLRRKTEQGTATVAYSATSPAAFDKGRATAPPAVPENRRAAVQTYFIRKQ